MNIRFILLTVLIACGMSVSAQNANFQGRVHINGQPATGQHTIEFYIGPPLNWSSTPASINIINGLYSTVINFPDNLFDSTFAFREMIVIMDTNKIIDTVTIFAPLERDPLVRGYIRDSISWKDIHNKPTVDTSYINETQLLSINEDTLSISDGNAIILPSISAVKGRFSVIDTNIQQLVSVSNAGTNTCNGNINTGIWQSFKATQSGKLRQIIIPVSESCSGTIIVYLYEGIGDGGQSLGYKSFPVSSIASLQILDFSSGVSSSSNGFISITNGNIYTFKITPSSGCFASVFCNNNNPYVYGTSSISAYTDMAFTAMIDHSVPANFTVTKNGHIGIGIDSATSQFEVKGRIKDMTGYLMPVGSVVAFVGPNIPEGWLLCDGRSINRTVYSDLFDAIGTSWGTANSIEFNLPDMRGQFLRGIDNSPTQGASDTDPDRTSRIVSNSGGNSGVNVGSKQADAFKNHTHQERPNIGNVWLNPFSSSGGTWPDAYNGNVLGPQTGATGGNETRPTNVYVYFIVKY
jgi:microcystin-dependent protein